MSDDHEPDMEPYGGKDAALQKNTKTAGQALSDEDLVRLRGHAAVHAKASGQLFHQGDIDALDMLHANINKRTAADPNGEQGMDSAVEDMLFEPIKVKGKK